MSHEVRFAIGGEAEVRPFVTDDAPALFDVVDSERDRLRRRMPWVDDTTDASVTLGFIERTRANEEGADGHGIWVAGEIAGAIGLMTDPPMRSGEVGYWIAKRFEGRGLVTRAAQRFVDFGFRDLGLHRIEINAASDNVRSRAIPERLGFTEEAVLREATRSCTGFFDMVVYGMLAREWAGRAR